MKKLVLALLVLCFSALGCQQGDDQVTQKAREIHDCVNTIDTHIDISTSNFTEEKNYKEDLGTQVTLPKMEEGGLEVAMLWGGNLMRVLDEVQRVAQEIQSEE